MKRVALYFNGKSRFGGAERRLSRIMNQIAELGVEVTLVFLLFEDFESIQNEYKKVVGEPFLINLIAFKSKKEVFRYVKEEKFDVVFYTDAYRDMLPFFFGAQLAKTKRVMLQVSTAASIGDFSNWRKKTIFNFVARNSSQIDCLYPSTRDQIQDRFKRQLVTVTPCPSTNLQVFKPRKKEKNLVFISRWVEGKNIELFLESMMMIEDRLYDGGYRVLLCGSRSKGEIEERVERMLSKATHPELFVMPGYVRPEDVLPSAEVFYSLQCINNYPSQSLLEAISCGCYVIASDEGDTSKIVSTNFGCLTKLDCEQIAKRTTEYFEFGMEKKNDIIISASEFARKNFVMKNSVNHYFEMIQSLTNE